MSKRMINIAFLTTRVFPDREGGGPAKFAYYLSKYTAKNNIKLFLISCSPLRNERNKIIKENSNFEIIYLPINALELKNQTLIQKLLFSLKFILFSLFKLIKLHRKYGLNIVQTQFPAITGLSALFFKILFNVPYIYIYHGIEYKNSLERIIDIKLPFKFANKILVITKRIRNYLLTQSKSSEARIQAISNGIVIPNKILHTETEKEYNSILERINLPQLKKEKKIITYVANMVFEQKVDGIIDFVRAFDEFLIEWDNPEKENIMLVIIGEGPFKSKLEHCCLKSINKNQILVIGLRKDVQDFFSIAELNALTSYIEGFPSVLLEAMVSGLSSIASDTGEIKEILGDTGFIVKPGDIQGIKKHLINIFSNPSIIITNREINYTKAKQYDYRKISNSFIKIYTEI